MRLPTVRTVENSFVVLRKLSVMTEHFRGAVIFPMNSSEPSLLLVHYLDMVRESC